MNAQEAYKILYSQSKSLEEMAVFLSTRDPYNLDVKEMLTLCVGLAETCALTKMNLALVVKDLGGPVKFNMVKMSDLKPYPNLDEESNIEPISDKFPMPPFEKDFFFKRGKD